jgi:hypothetical protein
MSLAGSTKRRAYLGFVIGDGEEVGLEELAELPLRSIGVPQFQVRQARLILGLLLLARAFVNLHDLNR